MFERYTETARRVIFFARYEASQFSSPTIEPEHLLLGLIREDKTLVSRYLGRARIALDSIRKEIEGRAPLREKISTSVELPLAPETKRVLAFAHEESDRLQHRHIGTEHLLLGLLREERSMAAEILYERGLRLNAVRDEVARFAGADSHASAARQQEEFIGASVGEIIKREVLAHLTGIGLAGETSAPGLAPVRAAELRRYPGPAQVLDLASELLLSEDQLTQVRKIYDRVLGEAAGLGRQIISQETELDGVFVGGGIDHNRFAAAEAEIARLQGELRSLHLRAYVETMGELSPEQIERYDKLRGHK